MVVARSWLFPCACYTAENGEVVAVETPIEAWLHQQFVLR